MEYFAHISEDNRQQTVLQHLEGTAELCSRFAMSFGAEDLGGLIGWRMTLGSTPMRFSADCKVARL